MKRTGIILCLLVFLFTGLSAENGYYHEYEMLSINLSNRLDEPENEYFIDEGTGKNEEKEEELPLIHSFKNEITKFSQENSINEFYVFPFLTGLFLGPLVVAFVFLLNFKHPMRKTIVKRVWMGWSWWVLIFSIILLI